MKTMPSAEFRKVYAKLTEITLVTVNGHTLGVWQPVSDTTEVTITQPKPSHTHVVSTSGVLTVPRDGEYRITGPEIAAEMTRDIPGLTLQSTRRAQQIARDRILRAINKD